MPPQKGDLTFHEASIRPVETTVDDSRQLTIFTICESLNYDEVAQAMEAFYAGKISKNVLWNFQDADVSEFDSQQIQRLARPPIWRLGFRGCFRYSARRKTCRFRSWFFGRWRMLLNGLARANNMCAHAGEM